LDYVLLGGERVAFDEDVWAEEVHRFRERGTARSVATAARTKIERLGRKLVA
jgi:hypothetical protein